MSQLPLSIVKKLAYKAEDFVLHSGVQSLVSHCINSEKSENFELFFIYADDRFGKTHLSLYLSSVFTSSLVDFTDGESLFCDYADYIRASNVDSKYILIIDDADLYFSLLKKADSGTFVNLIESIRQKSGMLIFMMEKSINDYAFDEHVMSRVRSAHTYRIDKPENDSIKEILKSLIRQRGFFLTDRQVGYLEKRLPSDIFSIERYVEELEDYCVKNSFSQGFEELEEVLNLFNSKRLTVDSI